MHNHMIVLLRNIIVIMQKINHSFSACECLAVSGVLLVH